MHPDSSNVAAMPPTRSATAGALAALKRLGDFHVRPRMWYIAALAVIVGAFSGVIAFALLKLIGLITNAIFYQRLNFELVLPAGADAAWYVILLAPIAGGLVVGLMARFGSEKIRGHGIPEALESVLIDGSRVSPKVSILKPIASAIAIGTGGPFGAEGPIIMTGGAFGSLFSQFLRVTADERKTLLSSGAVAGMAAVFNAPLASVLFAMELPLFEFRPRSLVPAGLAVTAATLVRFALLGTEPLFPITGVNLDLSLGDYGWCIIAGIIATLLAVVATILVYAAEDAYTRLPIHWMWWPAIGGLIVGIGGLIEPQALGVGYVLIGQELSGNMLLDAALILLVVKVLIWALSLSSGTSGGILAPMFIIGGALGVVEASVFPNVAPGFWALIGLAGVVSGVMRSPFTAIVFSLELTHFFDAVLPLILATMVTYGLSVLVLRRSILTEKISRHGYHLNRDYEVDPLEMLFVDEVMSTEVMTFGPRCPLPEMLATVFPEQSPPEQDITAHQRLYPLVDENGRLAGAVTRHSLLDAAFYPHPPSAAGDGKRLAGSKQAAGSTVTAAELCIPAAPLVAHPDNTLREVSYLMAEHRLSHLPVVQRGDEQHLLGLISLEQLLEARLLDLYEARASERIIHLRNQSIRQ